MEAYSTLASVFTVLSFVVFVGIVFWAYSARRTRSFEEAANEPFVLPDEAELRGVGTRGSVARDSFATGPSRAGEGNE